MIILLLIHIVAEKYLKAPHFWWLWKLHFSLSPDYVCLFLPRIIVYIIYRSNIALGLGSGGGNDCQK